MFVAFITGGVERDGSGVCASRKERKDRILVRHEVALIRVHDGVGQIPLAVRVGPRRVNVDCNLANKTDDVANDHDNIHGA